MAEARALAIHIARCDATGRWYVADSDMPGLRLEAEDAPSLIRRIELAAPEMLDLNAAELGANSPGGSRLEVVSHQ